MKLSEKVADLERRLEARDAHAVAPREKLRDGEQARRMCHLVLHDMALSSSTTTECVLAGYILDLIGERAAT